MPRSKSLNTLLGECAMSAMERQVRLDNHRLLVIREALLFSGREETEAISLFCYESVQISCIVSRINH